jgi:hypothetical protein
VVALLVVLLAVGGIFAATSWNSANLKGSGTITVTNSGGGGGTPVSLTYTTTLTADSVALPGSLSTNFTLATNGVTSNPTHPLGLTGTSETGLVDGIYGFKLNAAQSQETALTAYFAAKSGWTQAMETQIVSEIQGSSPFFYLNVTGGVSTLVDGFKFEQGITPTTLTIDDDYPVGTYIYNGTLQGVTGSNPSTLPITVTLIVARTTAWSINNVPVVTGSTNVTLTFTSATVSTGGSISVSAPLSVSNTGGTPINTWNIVSTAYPSSGSGWNLAVSQTAVAPGGSGTLTVTLTGTAPSNATTIDLSGVSCTLTPQS